MVNCYACGSSAGQYRQLVNDNYTIIKCGECGLEYTNPIPTEATLEQFYTEYQDIRADRRIVKLNTQEHLRMLEKYGWTPESNMLDFGAGIGIFMEMAGDNCYGVDLQPSSHMRIRRTLDDWDDLLWDFITLWGVLEHLADPIKVIRKLTDRLKPDGYMALTTVDAESIIPYYYKPPEHLSYWTRDAFDVLSRTCGLEIIKYGPYRMFQTGHIYVHRLLSRVPEGYRGYISNDLPEIVHVPTNEIQVVMRR